MSKIDEMLEIKKQIYTTKSWKRRKDLEKYLKRLETEFFKEERGQ